jgi:hypothetical protein
MSLKSIVGRVSALEVGRPVADRRVVSIVREADEPLPEAIARWCKAHPDEPPLVDDDNTLIIVNTVVDPKPQQDGRK